MAKPIISVIIPVYNVKPEFIDMAINSVLNQTLKDIEIILVNDGSTRDDTIEYLNNISNKKIRVIHQENEGAAFARCKGLRYSSCDYIGFLDADDWLDSNFYEILYNLCKDNNADFACGTLCKVTPNNKYDIDKFNNVVLTEYIDKMNFISNGSISSKLFNAKFFKQIKSHFKNRYWEDNPILIEAMLKSKRVAFTNLVRYFYRENTDSTCLNQNPIKKEKRLDDGLFILNEIYELVKNEKEPQKKITFKIFGPILFFKFEYQCDKNYRKKANKILNRKLVKYLKEIGRNSFIENIFSIKNEDIRKVITILGIKIKFKSKKLVEKQKLTHLNNMINELKIQQENLENKLFEQEVQQKQSIADLENKFTLQESIQKQLTSNLSKIVLPYSKQDAELNKKPDKLELYVPNNFASVGRCSYSSPDLFVTIPLKSTLGSFCSIGSQVIIGHGEHPVEFLSTSPYFHFDNLNFKNKDMVSHDEYWTSELDGVHIGNDVWIGSGVFIKNGVTIGDGAVIGAESVVTHDVPPYAIVIGNPARILKYRFDEQTIKDLLELKWWDLDDQIIKQIPYDNIENAVKFLKEQRVKSNE